MKNGLDDVGSIFGAGLAEQGSVRLQAHGGQPQFYFDTQKSGSLRQLFRSGWSEKLLTLANFSPCKLLTPVPSGCCSRRSTLFPTTHMEILSSAESWAREQMEVVKKNVCSLGKVTFINHPATNGECVHTHLDLIHPRSHVQEAAFRSDVVEEKDAVSFTEVGPGNAAKPTEKGAWIYTQQWIFSFLLFLLTKCHMKC